MLNTPVDKSKVGFWILYDFANSIAVVVFYIYFAQWLVLDKGVSDLGYNLLYVGGSILLLFTSPVLGAIADKKNIKMPYLRIMTTLQFVFLLAATIAAVFFPNVRGMVLVAALAYMLTNYFYQFTFTFYNALLPDLAPKEKQGWISGLGQAGNWSGQVIGLLITLPLATGAWYLFGAHGRAQTFLPATIIFFALALPALIKLKDKDPHPEIKVSGKLEYKNYFKHFRVLLKSPGIGAFLLGYFFFNDAILTVQNNVPIYLKQVFQSSDKAISLIAVCVLILAAFGAVSFGKISDRFGVRKTLIAILVMWVFVFPILGLAPNFICFAIVGTVLGFLYGGTWTVTRALMTELIPKTMENHGFSYYTMAERFATFLGPITWGVIILVLKPYGPWRYRIAMISMVMFVIIGLLIVRRIKPVETAETPAIPSVI